MAAVQYHNIDALITAYETWEGYCWAIAQGKNISHRGEDSNSLRTCLNGIAAGGTVAEYSLRLYNIEDYRGITPGVQYDGYITFKLNSPVEAQSVGSVTRVGAGALDPLTAKVNQYLADKVGKAIEEDLLGGGKQEKQTFADLLMGLLEDPEKIVTIINGVRSFTPGRSFAPAAMGSVQPKRMGAQDPEKMNRLAMAIDRLERCDPNIVETLEKLANLAETNPAMYKQGLSMISAF